jgi:glutamyl-tRNA reductase
MNVIVAGLSHKTAPVEIREKLSFAPQELTLPLQSIANLPEISEGIILSTCNRVEILFSSREEEKAIRAITGFLADHHAIPLDTIAPHLYFLTGQEAVKHVFRVASSLDSMIVGEPQILGQMKDAYRLAVASKTTGAILNRLLHKAFFVAKRVRTETNIASSAVSVSFAAVELSRKIFDELEDKKILLIGAGEMAELVVRHLIAHGVHDLFVANRTFDRAQNLVSEFGGKAIPFDEIALYLPQTDILVSSTSAQNFIITPEETTAALKMRKHKPVFMIDIAVPRTIDPRINSINNVYLYDIDDLEGIVESNKAQREEEASKAEKIIEIEKTIFYTWLRQQEVTPTIVRLKEKAERIRRGELDKTLSKWTTLQEQEKERLNALTTSIVNKILHDPITRLKDEGTKNGFSLDQIQKLFKLDEDSG